VVPAPYARDINVLGDESLSSTIDALLAESRTPMLVVRHPHDEIASCLKEVVIAATLHANEAIEPARWALRLMDREGQVTLLAVADSDTITEAASLLGAAVDPEALGEEALKRAEQRSIGALQSALQQRASAENLNTVVDVRAGKPATVIAAFADQRSCLVCIGRSKDRSSPSWHHLVDVLLNAHHPVLVT
jgi:nucleotide-binding universal stress UspA family protein